MDIHHQVTYHLLTLLVPTHLEVVLLVHIHLVEHILLAEHIPLEEHIHLAIILLDSLVIHHLVKLILPDLIHLLVDILRLVLILLARVLHRDSIHLEHIHQGIKWKSERSAVIRIMHSINMLC